MTSRSDLLQILTAQQELSRRRLLDFITYVNESYLADWFHRKLCAVLDKFLLAVAAGESPRLIIEAPPRHGKSEITSRNLPAYAIGRFGFRIVACSYGASLAQSMSRDVQRVMDGPDFLDLFPGVHLPGVGVGNSYKYTRTVEQFEVVDSKATYICAGVEGPITGKGGDLLILDDPVKDYEDAYSEAKRNAAWNWFTTTFMSRLEPGGGVLIIMTRWHEDDIVGRIKEKMAKGGEHWDVFSFPAIAEEDEEYRKAGEALCPSRYTLKDLERIKSGTEDINDVGLGSRAWNSLYQQRPSAREGEIFKRENWRYLSLPSGFFDATPKERISILRSQFGMMRLVQAWDTAIGSKRKNDYAARTTLAVLPTGYLALDVWKDKIKYPELRRSIQQGYDAWLPSIVFIEGGGSASGKAVVQDLEDVPVPIEEIGTDKDKTFRADLLSPLHETHHCFLPEGAPWVADFVDRAAKFPSLRNDDDIDSWMIAIEQTRGGSGGDLRINPELMRMLGCR